MLVRSREQGVRLLALQRPAIMGILNVTPDSFSDGGRHADHTQAIDAGLTMCEHGAHIIDVGGESTRPGASDVSTNAEIERVVPVIEALASKQILISIDTSKAEVMQAAVQAGACMINDVRALREPGALAVAVELNVPVCLMHMQGQPRSMQQAPVYDDVVAEVIAFLRERIDACVEAGLDRSLLFLDPGFGFGKTLEHNLCLLKHLRSFEALACPVLAGLSRKRMFGSILGVEVDDRVHGSVAGALMAVERGAAIVRVHDVRATAHALGVFTAVEGVDSSESANGLRSDVNETLK